MNYIFTGTTNFNNGQVPNDMTQPLFPGYTTSRPPMLNADPTGFAVGSALLNGNVPTWGTS